MRLCHCLPVAVIVVALLVRPLVASAGYCLPDSVLSAPSALVTTGQVPLKVIAADLDGDGFPDLVVANTGANNGSIANTGISILINDGHGGFPSSRPLIDAGLGPIDLVVLDLNGDGLPDLAVADSYSGSIEVLLGRGGGYFGPPTAYAVSSQLAGIAAGDLNHDGVPDLVVTASRQYRVNVMLGVGDGTFISSPGFSTSAFYSQPGPLALADFNQDGTPDLAVSLVGEGVAVYPGVGDGTFGPYQLIHYPGNWRPANLVVADVNRDGRLDLLFAGGSYGVWCAAGNGDGTFQPLQSSNGPLLASVAVADLDGDGRPDVAVTSAGSGAVGWMRNEVGDNFTMTQAPFAVPGVAGIAVADFDGDGRPDVAATERDAGGVVVLLNPCRGDPVLPTPPPPPPGPHDSRTSVMAWQANGVPVCVAPGMQSLPLAVADGTGGAFVAWWDERSIVQVGLARVTGDGCVAPGWPANGLLLTSLPTGAAPGGIATDGADGVLVAWLDERSGVTQVYLQHVLGSGAIAPGWPASGIYMVTPGLVTHVEIASDGAHGAFVFWRDRRSNPAAAYVLHVDAMGAPAAGWPVGGIPVAANVDGLGSIVADGSGGVYLGWSGTRTVYFGAEHEDGVAHVGADGMISGTNMVTGESSNTGPNLVADPPAGAVSAQGMARQLDVAHLGWGHWVQPDIRSYGFSVPVAIAPDRRGGLFEVALDSTRTRLHARHYDPSGSMVAQWDLDPPVVPAGFVGAVADSSGGAFLAWQDGRDGLVSLYGTRVGADGTPSSGWTLAGTPLGRAASAYEPVLISDGRAGAIAVWVDARNGNSDIFAQRIQAADFATATLAALVGSEASPEGVRLTWASSRPGLRARIERRDLATGWAPLGWIGADGLGTLVYDDRAVTPGSRYAYRLVVPTAPFDPLTAEAWVDVPARPHLALAGLQPNPGGPGATIAFTLEGGARAALEVFDVSGRRVLLRRFGAPAPGPYSVRLEADSRLHPGVYLLRLTQGGRSLSERACLLP